MAIWQGTVLNLTGRFLGATKCTCRRSGESRPRMFRLGRCVGVQFDRAGKCTPDQAATDNAEQKLAEPEGRSRLRRNNSPHRTAS